MKTLSKITLSGLLLFSCSQQCVSDTQQSGVLVNEKIKAKQAGQVLMKHRGKAGILGTLFGTLIIQDILFRLATRHEDESNKTNIVIIIKYILTHLWEGKDNDN